MKEGYYVVEYGCSSFLLETSKFMTVAQLIYKSAGFIEREEYPESETPTIFRPYQLFMEKKEVLDKKNMLQALNMRVYFFIFI